MSLPPTCPSSPIQSGAGGMAAGGESWHAASAEAGCRLSLATARLVVNEGILA
jgi:hypothetical protein